jgi:hypothetical protein
LPFISPSISEAYQRIHILLPDAARRKKVVHLFEFLRAAWYAKNGSPTIPSIAPSADYTEVRLSTLREAQTEAFKRYLDALLPNQPINRPAAPISPSKATNNALAQLLAGTAPQKAPVVDQFVINQWACFLTGHKVKPVANSLDELKQYLNPTMTALMEVSLESIRTLHVQQLLASAGEAVGSREPKYIPAVTSLKNTIGMKDPLAPLTNSDNFANAAEGLSTYTLAPVTLEEKITLEEFLKAKEASAVATVSEITRAN